MRVTTFGRRCFAAAMLALGVLGLVYGDFAMVWQAVPQWVPLRTPLAYACALLTLACGVGLWSSRTAALAARVLIVYLLLWFLLLRLPALLMKPLIEASWLGCGETAIMVAGGWALYATLAGSGEPARLTRLTGAAGVRAAQILFGLAILPCGLAHLVYTPDTAQLIPAWFPWHVFWAEFTGLAYIAAGLAIVFGYLERLAATLTAAMMAIITLVVWLPGVLTTPRDRLQWTANVISWTLVAGACVIADSYRSAPWLGFRSRPPREARNGGEASRIARATVAAPPAPGTRD